ncbi:hypothetical protein LCGC14_2762640, partial [marine sediment metagenome]
ILPAPVGDQMRAVLLEMPMKHSQIVGPMIEALNRAIRTDVNVNILPEESKSSPARTAAMKPPGEIPPKVKPKESKE